MRDYLMKLKSVCDNLASCGEVISEQEHVTAILNGLSPEYESVITVITANPNPSDLRTVRTILLDAESRQVSLVEQFPVSAHVVVQQQTTSPHVYTSSPNSQQGSSDQGTGTKNIAYRSDSSSGAYRGRGRGGRFSSSRPQCQLCGKTGHLVERCYRRFDIIFKNESSRAPQHSDNRSSQAQAHFMSFGADSPSNMVYDSAPVPSNVITQAPTHYVHTGAPHHYAAHQFQPSSSFPVQPPPYYAPVGLQVASSVPGGNHVSQVAAATSPAMTSQAAVPQALIATPEVVDDNSWYPDSGATHHLTKDLNNLQIGTTYPGTGTVKVGNGNTIPIQSIGQSTLLTSTRNLHLRNLLYVPNITKNLLSVSKFTQDNQVLLEFYPKCCKVKDLLTKKVLLEGSESGGLYQLNLSAFNSATNSSNKDLLGQCNLVSMSKLSQSKCVITDESVRTKSYGKSALFPELLVLNNHRGSAPACVVSKDVPNTSQTSCIPSNSPPQFSPLHPCTSSQDSPTLQSPSSSPSNTAIPPNPPSLQLPYPSPYDTSIPSDPSPYQLSSPCPSNTAIPPNPSPPRLSSPCPYNTSIPSDPSPYQLSSPCPYNTSIPSDPSPYQLSSPCPSNTAIPPNPSPPRLASPSPFNTAIPPSTGSQLTTLPPRVIPSAQNRHHMVTRSKSGIFKPKMRARLGVVSVEEVETFSINEQETGKVSQEKEEPEEYEATSSTTTVEPSPPSPDEEAIALHLTELVSCKRFADIPDPDLTEIVSCRRFTEIPDPDLTEIASCRLFTESPDSDLTELASYRRFTEIPDPDLTELASCRCFTEIPDPDLTELSSCSRFAEITDPDLMRVASYSRFIEIPDPDLTELASINALVYYDGQMKADASLGVVFQSANTVTIKLPKNCTYEILADAISTKVRHGEGKKLESVKYRLPASFVLE
ncbi:hypothetical protein GQ457_17G007820 [Hibiscus cannabinus]